MENRTKGQLEALISEAIIKFEKEYMGRGPMETKTYVIRDMVLVRLRGVLTPAEEQLSKNAEGAMLIKQTRMQLLEGAQPLLDNLIASLTGTTLKSLHSDISTKTGERIILFVLDQNLEDRYK